MPHMLPPACECQGATVPSKECSAKREYGGRHIFESDKFLFDRGCRCRDAAEMSRERSAFVRASALKFCSAILDKTADAKGKLGRLIAKHEIKEDDLVLEDLSDYDLEPEEKHLAEVATDLRDYVEEELGVTQKLCREVLTGSSREDQKWYSGAIELSKHKDAKGFGHLDPLVTGSVESHRVLLQKVCKDECEGIVDETIRNIEKMVDEDVSKKTMPFEQSCADRVVRKVTEDEKVSWLDECCTEYNVLEGSSRDNMCNSVLSEHQVQKISKFDTKAKEDTDVGGAYIGQDPRLLWAEPGIEEFRKELQGLGTMPKKDDLVSSDFLEKHLDVRKEGIRQKWFREEMMTDEKGKSSSFTEIGITTCESSLKNLKDQHCPRELGTQIRDTCLRQEKGWQASVKPESDDPDEELTCQEKMIHPSINPPTKVATPDQCLEVNLTQVGDFKRRFFVYDTTDPPGGKVVLEKPILCFAEPQKLRCPPKEDFQGRNVRNLDFNPDKGFADYIYWVDLD